jgi:hypothetical protein
MHYKNYLLLSNVLSICLLFIPSAGALLLPPAASCLLLLNNMAADVSSHNQCLQPHQPHLSVCTSQTIVQQLSCMSGFGVA